MYEVPSWSIKVQAKMLRTGMTKKELAAKIGCNYTQLVNVMSGLVINQNLRRKIENYFGFGGEKNEK